MVDELVFDGLIVVLFVEFVSEDEACSSGEEVDMLDDETIVPDLSEAYWPGAVDVILSEELSDMNAVATDRTVGLWPMAHVLSGASNIIDIESLPRFPAITYGEVG